MKVKRFFPFMKYESEFGELTFLYYEEITRSPVFVDEDGFIHIFEYGIEFYKSNVGLN